MDGDEQPSYPPSPQNNGGDDDNAINDDNDQPSQSPLLQNNDHDRLGDDQHKEDSHKRNNDRKQSSRQHDNNNSSRRGRKERRRRKRNRHHSNNNDEPLNYELHHHMHRNFNNNNNNNREMREYNIDRDHKNKRERKESRRRREDDRDVYLDWLGDAALGFNNMGSANHRRSHSWSSPRKQHNHQSSSRRRSRDDHRRKKNRSRSCSDDSRFDQRRSRHSSRHAMKRYSRSYSRDRSSSSISTRRRERRRDDSSRRRDRGRHRYQDSSSSSRERSRRRDRRHRRRRNEDRRPNRRNNNIAEGQNNREEGNESIRIVVSEDSDNHFGAVGGKADNIAVAVDQMEIPSKRDSASSVESNRKKSASNKKSRHRHRSKRQRSASSRSGYSSRSQGEDSSFKRRSYSRSPPLGSKIASSKKKKKKSRRRRDRSSSASLSRSRSRDRRRSSYSRCSSPGSRHRSSSPRMYSGHDHKREHFSRSRSFSSSRSDYKKQNKRRHRSKKNKKKDKKKKHESHQSGSSRDDTVGHFHGGPGTVIDYRYRIIRDVGLGTFGRVVQCENLRQNHRQSSSSWHDQKDNINTTVAIKVVRNIQRYHESAIIEADICERINMEQSRQKKDLCAALLDRFSLSSGHYCLAFECLGKSLYDFLKMHKYRPFPMFCVRDFAQQLLETLEFLHGFGLIHTDLKLENILLSNNEETTYRCWDGSSQRIPVSTKIKVIDFGGATYDDEKKSSIVNTRQYRAPEVILGWGWSFPSDLWSAGCIIAELYMGELLFGTHDNEEHLALIERAVGPFPKELLQTSTSPLAKECFDSHGWHKIRGVLSSRSIEHVRKMVPVEQMIAEYDRPSGLGRLLRSLLDIDPKRRITAREALMSPFFTQRR